MKFYLKKTSRNENNQKINEMEKIAPILFHPWRVILELIQRLFSDSGDTLGATFLKLGTITAANSNRKYT